MTATPEELAAASGERAWDDLAPWWKREFTDGADIEYEKQIIPIIDGALIGATRVLDLGCGEGQISRRVSTYKTVEHVVGIDPSRGQLAFTKSSTTPTGVSKKKHAPITYVQGVGEQLPFADNYFDAAVCCLAIEHANDGDAVLREAVRVLAPGGRFILLVNHPMYQGEGSGFVDDQILNEQYWRVGPYLGEATSVEEVDQGVFISFTHRPLSRYLNPLAELDFLLTKMHEPAPLEEFLEQSIAPELERLVPRLLVMCFEHRPRP